MKGLRKAMAMQKGLTQVRFQGTTPDSSCNEIEAKEIPSTSEYQPPVTPPTDNPTPSSTTQPKERELPPAKKKFDGKAASREAKLRKKDPIVPDYWRDTLSHKFVPTQPGSIFRRVSTPVERPEKPANSFPPFRRLDLKDSK